MEGFVDTEKKPNQDTEQPKQDIGQMVGDLVVSGATVLAHSAVEAVVKRVRKATAKTGPVKAVAKAVKKAKKSADASRAKSKKAKKVPSKPVRRKALVRKLRRDTPKNYQEEVEEIQTLKEI
jgi:hypothetical protein